MWGKMFIFANEFNIKGVHMRFLGKTEAKLDIKGRVFLPSSFRKELQSFEVERLVLRKDVFNDCLVVYPENIWNRQMDALSLPIYCGFVDICAGRSYRTRCWLHAL